MKAGFAPVMVQCRGCQQILVQQMNLYVVEISDWELFKFEAELLVRPPRHSGCNNSVPMLLVDGQPLRDRSS